MIRTAILAFAIIITSINFLSAEDYFSTLKYDKVNLRQGPAKNYPVKIFYKKKYPKKIKVVYSLNNNH